MKSWSEMNQAVATIDTSDLRAIAEVLNEREALLKRLAPSVTLAPSDVLVLREALDAGEALAGRLADLRRDVAREWHSLNRLRGAAGGRAPVSAGISVSL